MRSIFAALLIASMASSVVASERPNVLFIAIDDINDWVGPLGGHGSLKGRPMLAAVGENDKRLVNFRKIDEEARAAGVDIEFVVFKDSGHAMPPGSNEKFREWLKEAIAR